MVKVKVTRNYQITIPAEIRAKIGLKEGEEVEVYLDDSDRILIERISSKRRTLTSGKKLTSEEIDEIIAKGIVESLK